jgi:hypothetical protein
MDNAVSGSRLKAAVLSAWIILALFTQAFCTPSYADDCETARPKVGESSSSNSATTPASRKSFYDSTSKLHWAFWYNGSAIEYASSDGSQSWVSQGTIAYNTANFSLISKLSVGQPTYS